MNRKIHRKSRTSHMNQKKKNTQKIKSLTYEQKDAHKIKNVLFSLLFFFRRHKNIRLCLRKNFLYIKAKSIVCPPFSLIASFHGNMKAITLFGKHIWSFWSQEWISWPRLRSKFCSVYTFLSSLIELIHARLRVFIMSTFIRATLEPGQNNNQRLDQGAPVCGLYSYCCSRLRCSHWFTVWLRHLTYSHWL